MNIRKRWFKLALLLMLTFAVAVPSTLAYIVARSETLVNTFVPPHFPAEPTSVQLRVQKTVSCIGTQTIGPGGFSFVLRNAAGGENITLITDGDGNASVTLPFTEADAGKTYTYRLYEINDGRESVTYSTAVHTIDIALSIDADNRMVATLTQNGKPVEQVTAHFENIYAAGSVPPQTGDRCQPLLWMVLMLISLTGMALMMRRMVRR